ncbi:MAG TPA: glucose-6-phosphate isomerase [Firmicutes bacterium]|nr:glucose-6-phosphate isomerase [Bacillota bacterium]
MNKLTFSYKQADIKETEMKALAPAVGLAHDQLHDKSGAGSDFLGWLDLPKTSDQKELERIKTAAAKIQNDSEHLIVIGIGGSYLGARAGIEMLCHSFHNYLPAAERKAPRVFFAGTNLSAAYLKDLIELIRDEDFSVNVISKSGTTLEPALALRVLKDLLEEKYGREEASRRIYATTDAREGALRAVAEAEGWESFIIPPDVGGRFSVLTAVGLLPLAAAGIDITEILDGAAAAHSRCSKRELSDNPAYQYAASRNILARRSKIIEILANYEPGLQFFNEWWKQLFGESEGKDGRGIFPASVNFTADLHSLGQLMQDGSRNIFATTLWAEKSRRALAVPGRAIDGDGLNYLAGRDFQFVNQQAFQGTVSAHTEGGVPNLVIQVPAFTPYYFGALVYFFEKACATSGYLLGVNPFDQPGVEAYKKKMFALLGKQKPEGSSGAGS